MKLSTPIIQVPGVGNTLEKRFRSMGIQTIEDLLFHLPFRYEDYSTIKKIHHLRSGESVTIQGIIQAIDSRRSKKRYLHIIEAVVADDEGFIRVVWFGQPYITKKLSIGDKVYLSGIVKEDNFGLQLVSPRYEKITEAHQTRGGAIVPVYPLTSGIKQTQIQHVIESILSLSNNIPDWLPKKIQQQAKVISLSDALTLVHAPKTEQEYILARKRLAFDELFTLQLRAEVIRQSQQESRAIAVSFFKQQMKQFVDALPFELTKDQKVSSWQIIQDMEKPIPMNRLLEGDVGSGKTVVAAMVIKNTSLQHLQSAVMAPTEILAKQHFVSFQKLLPGLTIGLLTGAQTEVFGLNLKEQSKTKRRNEFLNLLKSGEINVVIGTHALLTSTVLFHNLALVIIDEQHRFGVNQRKILKEKSGDFHTSPHFLSMTATPIPRSFALTIYGELDISIIQTMPKGRKQIKTRLVEKANRQKAYQFIRTHIQAGRQAFVICPLIEESETTTSADKKSVLAEYEKLSQSIFPDLKVEYVHGKMKAKEKDVIMNRFAHKEFDILVSTSVVEVGVNIPNATVMMIESAERFGLAQLHQFRGRVGRANYQSYCFIFSESESPQIQERLRFFESCTNGFALAEYDLQTRGPGDVYGLAQSGILHLKVANIQDIELIQKAKNIARGIDFLKYPKLKKRVEEWEQTVHLE